MTQFPHAYTTIPGQDPSKVRPLFASCGCVANSGCGCCPADCGPMPFPPRDLLIRLRDLPEPEPHIAFVTLEDVADRVVTMEELP